MKTPQERLPVYTKLIFELAHSKGKDVALYILNHLSEVVSDELWRHGTSADGEPFECLSDYLQAKWPHGPHIDPATSTGSLSIDDIIDLADNHGYGTLAKVLGAERKAFQRSEGRPAKTVDNVNSLERPTGNSRTYIEQRLSEQFPDIWRAYLDGEYKSARAAGIAAGFVPKTVTVRVDDVEKAVRTLLKHFTPGQLEQGLQAAAHYGR